MGRSPPSPSPFPCSVQHQKQPHCLMYSWPLFAHITEALAGGLKPDLSLLSGPHRTRGSHLAAAADSPDSSVIVRDAMVKGIFPSLAVDERSVKPASSDAVDAADFSFVKILPAESAVLVASNLPKALSSYRDDAHHMRKSFRGSFVPEKNNVLDFDCMSASTPRAQQASADGMSKEKGSSSYSWEYSFLLPHVNCSGRPPLIQSDCFKSADRSRTTPRNRSRYPASCKLTLRKIPFSNLQVHVKSRTVTDSDTIKQGKSTQKQNHKGVRVTRKGQLQHFQILKQLFCGGVAGVISRSAVAPLDLIKTYLITSHGLRGSQKTAIAVFKDIVESSGWQGLFRGNLVNCIRVAPSKAIELCVFEMVRRELGKEGHPLKNIAAVVAGGAAGMAGTFATYPLELLRTRLSVQPELYTGLLQAVHKIFTQEGFFAFYSGLTPSLVGVFPYAATNYFVYDGLRNTYRRTTGKSNVPTLPTLAFGAVAAAASSAVTYPLEVARRHMQLSLMDTAKKSSVGVILDIYRHEGFLALYRGLGTTWLKLIPAAGISFVCYEAARLALHIDDASFVIKAEVAEESDPIP